MVKAKLILLIVDDNTWFVERMICLLKGIKNIGYINLAHNYEEAILCMERERPDVVLLDINLPDKNGIEVLNKIRDSGWKCSVIMISNHDNEFYRQQCRELGATYFLDKSKDFGLVPSIISRMKPI